MTTFDINDLASFTSAYTDNAPVGDGLARIHWHNGDPGARTPGSFFLTRRNAENNGVTVNGSPWREITRTFRSGESEDGYEARALKIAVLGVRQHDVVIDPEGVMTYVGRTPRGAARPAGWSLYVEILCMAQGLNQPVVWASKRIKTSMAMVTMLRAYRFELLDQVKQEKRNPNVPSWAFWLPIRGEVDAKRQPVYERTKGAPVTPPKLILPEGDALTMARNLYVGKQLLEIGEELRNEYDGWLKATPADAAPPAAPSHNTPQPIGDDDLSF